MSVNRKDAKRDANETPIVDALREVGATVSRVSAKGFPDLVVGFRGVNYLLEVKSATKELTPDQIEFGKLWNGQVSVVRSIDDALRVIGATA